MSDSCSRWLLIGRKKEGHCQLERKFTTNICSPWQKGRNTGITISISFNLSSGVPRLESHDPLAHRFSGVKCHSHGGTEGGGMCSAARVGAGHKGKLPPASELLKNAERD